MRQMPKRSDFRASRLFTILAMVCVLAVATPGGAQEARPDASRAPSAVLLDILKDEAARNALIAELERTADAAGATEAAAVAPPDAAEPMSLGRQLALITQETAEGAARTFERTWRGLTRSDQVFAALGGNEVAVLWEALKSLLLVIVLTVSLFLVLRRVCIPIYRRMGNRAQSAELVETGLLFGGSVMLDLLIVVAAWALGYAAAVLVLGDFGQIGIRQTLYLNAFLIVETVKVGMRAVLSPSSAGLRPVPLNDAAARSLGRHANLVISVLGYGQLLVVPIVNQNASFAAGRGVSALLSIFVLLYLVTLVVRKRRVVSGWLLDLTAPPQAPDLTEDQGAQMAPAPRRLGVRRPSKTIRTLAQDWHWFALLYLAVMFIVVMTRPTPVVFGAVFASGKIALALIVASVVSGLLARAIARGVSLPADLNSRIPLLERRLNGFVPHALLVIRFVIVGGLLLFALDVLGVIRLRGWLESQFGLQLTATAIGVALTLLVAAGIWLAMTSWVDYRLNPDCGKAPTARETTLLTLLRNAATIVIVTLAVMFGLSEIGLDIGPLLASAGVLGLAIGFGSQKMVQDIITGIFIQFENAINVGDVITVGGITGGVEKLTVRSVSLRDVNGTFHIIPFSSVDMVSNFTRDFSYYVCDMGIAYRESVDDAKAAMFDAFEELRADPDHGAAILADLEWFGLNTFGDSAVVVRGRIKTIPGKQWGIGRAFNGILKRIFDERGIEIPFPHQTIYFGEAKDGSTQTLKVAGPTGETAEN